MSIHKDKSKKKRKEEQEKNPCVGVYYKFMNFKINE